MDYIKKIVLNWILYSSDLVYTYKTKCKIVRYVKENPNDALLVASGLYFLDENSEKIIVSAKGHNFLEDMNRYKYAFFKRKDFSILFNIFDSSKQSIKSDEFNLLLFLNTNLIFPKSKVNISLKFLIAD